MFLPKKLPHRLLQLPNRQSDSGSGAGFSQIFYSWSGSGPKEKQNLAGVYSCNADLVASLNCMYLYNATAVWFQPC